MQGRFGEIPDRWVDGRPQSLDDRIQLTIKSNYIIKSTLSNPLSPPRMMLSTTSLKKQIPSSKKWLCIALMGMTASGAQAALVSFGAPGGATDIVIAKKSLNDDKTYDDTISSPATEYNGTAFSYASVAEDGGKTSAEDIRQGTSRDVFRLSENVFEARVQTIGGGFQGMVAFHFDAASTVDSITMEADASAAGTLDYRFILRDSSTSNFFISDAVTLGVTISVSTLDWFTYSTVQGYDATDDNIGIVAQTIDFNTAMFDRAGYYVDGWIDQDGNASGNTFVTSDLIYFETTAIPEPSALAITEVEYDPVGDPGPTVTLTWTKTGAASYSVFYSFDLIDWGADLDDSVLLESDENPEDADQMTVTFPLVGPLENAPDAFFRVDGN